MKGLPQARIASRPPTREIATSRLFATCAWKRVSRSMNGIRWAAQITEPATASTASAPAAIRPGRSIVSVPASRAMPTPPTT